MTNLQVKFKKFTINLVENFLSEGILYGAITCKACKVINENKYKNTDINLIYIK